MQNSTARSAEQTKRLRTAAGQWLKSLREARGLTQRALAERVGLRYYTFVSQIEGGHGRIPPEYYAAWADALGTDRRTFASQILYYYDPHLYSMLFHNRAYEEPESGRSGAVYSGTSDADDRLRL